MKILRALLIIWILSKSTQSDHVNVISEYDVVSYFCGKVRSTGISRMLAYFDIIPRPGLDLEALDMHLVLKDCNISSTFEDCRVILVLT